MERIPLAKPFWDEECESAALKTLSSGRWVKGPQGQAFGKEFAEWCGALSAAPCQSGSAALWAALKLFDIGPGDEVIVPGMTFISTATCVSLVGATPVFADVEEDYWCICPKDLESKITEKTKAVIAVHLFGQPFSEKIREICDKYGLALIEDAAQAHGAMLNGKMAGSIGDVACFSFFPSKNMAVGGEGGMICTIKADLADKLDRIVNHGRNQNLESIELGTNMRMSEVNAAIGRVQLKHVDEWVKKRNENALKINHLTPVRENSVHGWHQLCIFTDEPDDLVSRMNENEIDARVHYPLILNKHAVYKDHFQHGLDLPVSEKISKKLVAIPVHPSLSEFDIERINSVLNE